MSGSLRVLWLLALGLAVGCGGGGGGNGPEDPGLEPGLETARPFQLLSLGSAGLGTQDDAFVRFLDGDGYQVDVPVASVDPIQVPVPVYVDPATGEDEVGVVSLELHAEGRDPVLLDGLLTILRMPPTGRAPGAISEAFFRAVRDVIPKARGDLETLALDPPDGVTVYADLFLMLDDLEAALDVWIALLPDVRADAIGPAAVAALLGSSAGDLPLDVDRDLLLLCDRMLAVWLQGIEPGTTGGGLEALARDLPARLDAFAPDAVPLTQRLLEGVAATMATGDGVGRTATSTGAVEAPAVVAASAWLGAAFATGALGAQADATALMLLEADPASARPELVTLRYPGTRMLWSAAANLAGWEIVEIEAAASSAATFDVYDAFIGHVGAVGTLLLRALDAHPDPGEPPPIPPERTLTGTYSGFGTFQNTVGSACRFNVTINGTLTVNLSTTLGATAGGTGAWSAKPVAGTVGGTQCLESSGPADFGTSATWAVDVVQFQAGSAPAFAFDGRLSGNVLVGTLTVTFPNATGSIVVPSVTLR